MTATNILTSLSISKEAGVQSLTINRRADGSFSFTNKNGRAVTVHGSEDMRVLFEALAALDT